MRRGLIVLAALAAGLTLAILLAIHTPWARSRAMTWASLGARVDSATAASAVIALVRCP